MRRKFRRALPNPKASETLADLPQLPQVRASIGPLSKPRYSHHDSILQVVANQRRRVPFAAEFSARRARLGLRLHKPVAYNLASGSTAVQIDVNPRKPFECLSQLSAALKMIQLPAGGKLALDLRRASGMRKLSRLATYAATVHAAAMPTFSELKHPAKPTTISVNGYSGWNEVAFGLAAAEANTLCRQLCILPSNVLDAKKFVTIAETAAKIHGFEYVFHDLKQLRKLKANLFLSVCGGNKHGGLVRLRYRCGQANARHIAVLGKGVCFDTGGINLKPHQHMLGMQGDMAGAAAALGALIATKRLNLKVDLDVWLAVAENLLSADACRPGDTLTSHNGKSVEIVHTDAEGRMLLADSLSILADDKPDMVITLATLTGSIVTAVGDHMSGVTGTPELVEQAQQIGMQCGERLVPFPLPQDYLVYLKSDVADLLQCSAGNEPDHILAGLFLKEFTGNLPWLHLDLAASTSKGGLGAVPTRQTGFSAAWLLAWLEKQSQTVVRR